MVLLAGSLLWSRSLRRQVDARTRELARKRALFEAEAKNVRALNAELGSRPGRGATFWFTLGPARPA